VGKARHARIGVAPIAGIAMTASLLACGSRAELAMAPGHPHGVAKPTAGVQAPSGDDSAPASTSSAQVGEPVLVATDARAMARLEASGLSIGAAVFGGGDARLATFAEDPGWASIRGTLERDLARRLAADPKAGVGMRHPHRAFDVGWLRSAKTRLELVAVANRIDRRAFDRDPARCGELRLVYRLAYATTLEDTSVDSRLPMTVNVVFWQPGEDCKDVARRWLSTPGLEGAALADALRAGPLRPELLHARNLKSVEVNLQTLRWPGVIHPSLGGHAEYELRVFRRAPGMSTGAFAPSPLENTPDVQAIARSDAKRSELKAWIVANLSAIDEGTALLPDALTTDLAVSVAPRGLARLANRPYSQLLATADLEALPLEGHARISTAAALVRRLDELTCQGCHETRSIAGFHVVGAPRDPEAVLDTVAVATSAHLQADLPRRRAYVLALAEGRDVDEARPLAGFDEARGYGAHCGLGDAAFASWTCETGLGCTRLDDPLLGTCLPADGKRAGDPCELGELRTHADGHRDRVRAAKTEACAAEAVCNVNAMGFPTGMCTAGCGELARGEACGPIVDFTAFNACVGRRRPFPKCIELAAHPVGLRACDERERCRDDYVCARSAWDARGVCLPPYFLFQLRVDGHVL
jgi:hypothetical protein